MNIPNKQDLIEFLKSLDGVSNIKVIPNKPIKELDLSNASPLVRRAVIKRENSQ